MLIDHPNTDYQLPAGGVRKTEEYITAAKREAEEETGLEDLVVIGELEKQTRVFDEHARTVRKSKVHARPNRISSTFGVLRKGLLVKIIEKRGKYTQIRYRERDNSKPDRPVMLNIKGWIKSNRLSNVEERAFFVLKSNDTRSEPWILIADHHKLKISWFDLDDLPILGTTQQQWADQHWDQLLSILKDHHS